MNTGGAGGLGTFVLSYLFDEKPVNFFDFIFRKENRIEHTWSAFYVPGKRYIDKPVYVLNSAGTFSGGEAFAYILQSLKRATLIGERTGGGASTGDLIKLNNHFVMNLPVGRPVSPVTKNNWEGTGVQPDIAISREQALNTAHITALKKLIEMSRDEKTGQRLKDILARVQTTSK